MARPSAGEATFWRAEFENAVVWLPADKISGVLTWISVEDSKQWVFALCQTRPSCWDCGRSAEDTLQAAGDVAAQKPESLLGVAGVWFEKCATLGYKKYFFFFLAFKDVQAIKTRH